MSRLRVPLEAQADFSGRDAPTPAFVESMGRQFETERETRELLDRKLSRRAGPPYQRISMEQLIEHLRAMLTDKIGGDFMISETRWFTGGVSKIQLGFTLHWNDPARGPSTDRLVVRMDPTESMNATSRTREFELLQAFSGHIPVPRVFWLDPDARWFPEPALVYEFVDGVTKPSDTSSGRISGLGTRFGPELRKILVPQFIDYLARIHTFKHEACSFTSLDKPEVGSTQSALWQLNRARRMWEEDRGEDFPLLEVASNWLERNLPTLDHVSVVHGDYRSGNFLFNEADGQIRAWLDWERAHLGDRHRDLAWTTQPVFGHYLDDGKTYYVCGLMPLEEFYDRYEQASGLPVDRRKLDYYRILNDYQIIVTTVASGYRVARLGKSHQDVLLARVKGQAPVNASILARMLEERL
ncbi:MAG: phosphotransferase family protein [Pseudomonadota bacterium]